MDKADVVQNIIQPQKEWNIAICSNMDGSRDYHIKVKPKITIVWDHLYVESKKQ